MIPEDQYWAEKAAELRRTQLDNVRAVAGKWQASIAGLLGIITTVAIVQGTTKVAELDEVVADPLRWAVSIAAGVALLGLLAATYAAQGIPTKKSIPTSPELRSWTEEEAGRAAIALFASRVLIILATLILVAGTLFALWKSPTKPTEAAPSTHLVVVGDGYALCGELSVLTNGLVGISTASQEVALSADQSILVVAGCP